MRWLFLLFVPAVLVLSQTATAASRADERTTISGGDLLFAVRLTAADEDSFRRRINYPPVYERETPEARGPSFTVTSTYWEPVVQTERRHPGRVSAEAEYFPEGGLVRASQEGEDVWLTLNLRQRAILDRYVRLAREGRISAEPTVVELLLAASDEPLSVDIGAKTLDSRETAAFWQALAASQRQTGASQERDLVVNRYLVDPRPDDIWLIFTFAEARAVRLIYEPASGRVMDVFEPVVYQGQPRFLENAVGNGQAFRPLQVQHADSPGSPVWWFIMIGGGLILIAAGVFIRRRFA